MSEIVRLDPKEEQLDNTIYPVDQGLYIADNGRIISEFYQVDNEVVVNSKGRRISWSPYDMRYIDEFGMEDPVFTVQEVPLETKANYARYNRAMPDVDDWFIQENDRLKHQILIQGFQPDPSPWMFGKLDFAIGGKMRFDSDLRIVADGVDHVNPFETHGAIQLYDGEELIFELPQVIAFDSAYDRSMTFGKYRVWFDDNGEMMFDIIVDYEWMTAAERVYPVVIDPTVVVTSNLLLPTGDGKAVVVTDDKTIITAAYLGTGKLHFYKSVDEGNTSSQICFATLPRVGADSLGGFSLEVVGDYVHAFAGDGNGYFLLSFNYKTQTNVDIGPSKITFNTNTGGNQTSVVSYHDKVRGFIHSALADLNEIYYVKCTINPDGTITPGTVSIINTVSGGPQHKYLSMTVNPTNGNPIIFYSMYTGTSYIIRRMYFNGTAWTKPTTSLGTSNVGIPVIRTDKNGRHHLIFNNTNTYIQYAYTDDGYADISLLSSPVSLTTSTSQNPFLTIDYDNKLYVTYNGVYRMISPDRGATWGAPVLVESGKTHSNLSFDSGFTSGIIGNIYRDANGIYFNGIFLNRPPNTPSNLMRTSFDATGSAKFTWTYSDPDPNDPQSAYQLQIVNAATSNIILDTGKVPSTVAEHTLTAGALANNLHLQWRVKTWDNADFASPWSDYATFFTSAKPSLAITNLADGQIFPINTLTVEWTMSDPESEGQSAYQAKILSPSNVVLADTGKVMDARSRARTMNFELLNGQSYKVSLTVWDAKDVKSIEQILTINVDYTEPTVPLLTTSTDTTRGTITIHIEHPAPVFPQPTVINTDIYRRKLGETAWERIGVGVDPAFIDYTPASEQMYEYKVRGWGDNQIYTDSAIISESVKLQSSQLALVSDYSKVVHMKYDPSRSEVESRDRAVSHFAGRREPVAEFGDNRNNELSMSFVLNEKADLDLLRYLVDAGQTLLYRDNRGRKMFCSVGNIQIDDEQALYYKVAVPMTRVSHTEEV